MAKCVECSTDVVQIGGGFCSDAQESFEGDALDLMLRMLTKETAKQAYEEAGVGPEDIDVVELHDCFTSNEILLYNALGLCEGGDLERFVMEDENSYGGKVVVCPSGGLLAKGHPMAVALNDAMSRARYEFRWEDQYRLTLDPARARRFREASLRKKQDPSARCCTMCGPDFCAMKITQGI